MRKVNAAIQINTTPKKIIEAFLDHDQLKEWWQVERSLIDARPGGTYTLGWNITEQGFGYVATGMIQALDPDLLTIKPYVYLHPLRPILGPMSLVIQVRDQRAPALLEICQDGYGTGVDWDWYYAAVTVAWPVVLKTLKEYLESHE